jgi:hypothetical protein
LNRAEQLEAGLVPLQVKPSFRHDGRQYAGLYLGDELLGTADMTLATAEAIAKWFNRQVIANIHRQVYKDL